MAKRLIELIAEVGKRRGFQADLLLFIGLWAVFSYFFQGGFANQNSRFDLTLALAFEGRPSIDSFHWNTIDKVLSGGHYFSEKAPGASYLALPVPLFASTLIPKEALFLDPALGDRLLYLSTVLSVSLVSALSAVAFRRFLCLLNPRRTLGEAAILTGLTYLGTLIFPYSTQLMGHQFAGSFLLLGLYLGYRAAAAEKESEAYRKGSVASLFFGLATFCEYPAAIPSVILGLSLIGKAKHRASLLRSCLWAVLPAAALLLHNAISFGDPFSLGYGKLQGTQFATQMSQGFFGIRLPDPARIAQLAFGPYRGLFVYCPILIVAAGSFAFRERERHSPAVAILVSSAATIAVNSSYGYWQGGVCFGPRHLVPIIPILALGLAYLPKAWMRNPVFVAVSALSVAINLVGTATTPYVSEYDTSPLTRSYARFVLEGSLSRNPMSLLTPHAEIWRRWPHPEDYPLVSWNWGERLGLHGWLSIAPLLGFLAILAAVVARRGSVAIDD